MSTNTAPSPIDIADLEYTLKTCAEGFAQLAALLNVIRERSEENSEAALLAAMGWTAALEMDNAVLPVLHRLKERKN